jgi:hypothetical protein
MPIINKGTAFSNGEQLTADKINNLLDLATFNQSATDSASTTVNSASQIVVADSGITTAKLATDAVETAKIKDANVTKAKIEDVADYKVLGNVSGAAAAPAEVAILDEDDMVSNSATALATQQSIKAYVDGGFAPSTYAGEESVTLPNGLIMKFGIATGVTAEGGNPTINFAVPFPTGVVNAQATTTNASGGTSTSYDYYYQIESTSLSSLTLTQQNPNNPVSAAHNVHWMVIGR